MSTPAELLMQLQEVSPSTAASFNVDSPSIDVIESEITSNVISPDVEEEKVEFSTKTVLPPSILDESAFPILGSAATGTPNKLIWGSSDVVNGNGHKKANPVMFRSSNIQESFTIDLDQQVSITKGELFKLTSALKKDYKVSIESTLSLRTNKRTFLITGSEDAIKKVRREIIKKLTKPVVIEFSVPSKLRRIIIGPSGRTLTPIVNATGVKIDIEKENSRAATPSIDASEDEGDDFFGNPVSVKISGDAEGAQTAKAMIMAIVEQNTRNISVKVNVPVKLRPFAKTVLESTLTIPEGVEVSIPDAIENSSKIFISGPREEVLVVRDEISLALKKLERSIKTESKPIKKSFHRFINPNVVFEKTSVLVEIPSNGDSSSEIIYTGKPEDIRRALELTKEITDGYKVLALEISRAHGGDIHHAKNLSAYFKYSGFLDDISNESITVSVPSYSSLSGDEMKPVQIDISCSSGTGRDEAEAVKKSIINKVNEMAPYSVKSITDIEPFVFSHIDSSINDVAKENKVTIIPLATLGGVGSTLLLVADPVENDFLPTLDEIAQRINAVDASLENLRKLSSSLTTEVISVPSAEQKLIYGNNGSTLNTILSQYAKDAVEIRLNQNETGNSDDELLIRGFKDEVPQVIKQIQQLIEDIKNHDEAVKYNDTITFPTKLLSRLIGQKGAHLNTLRDKFDVRIDVDEHDDKATETTIKLTGLKVNVDAIIEEIKSESKKWADEKTSKLAIERKYHRALVGKNRVYTKRLEDKYKVSIWFPYDDSPNHDEVVIRGPSKGVTKAEEELKELLKYEIENGYKAVITVPVEAIPRVIGKGGDTINGIATETGVEFRFTRDDLKEKELGRTEIEVVGTKSAIKAAEAKIKAIIETVENTITSSIVVDPKYHRLIVGPSGSTMREIIRKAGGSDENSRRLLQIPNHESDSKEIVSTGNKEVVESILKQIEDLVLEKAKEVSEVCEIPKEKHRSLIGPGGSIRKNLETEFKVNINIPRLDSNSTSVTITGSPENIAAARLKITELTKDDWLAELMVPASVHSAIAERGSFFKRLRNDHKVSVEHGPSSRIATKLSNSNIPQPPSEAFGAEDEKSKWTFIDDSEDKAEEQKIPWRLKGEAAQVEKAERIIQKLIDQSINHDTTGYFYSSKPALFSKIVGPQGRRVQQLRERSGCFIVVPRIDDAVNNIIYVRGNKEGIEKVKNSFLASLD